MSVAAIVLASRTLAFETDGLYAAVAHDLSARYCPVDRTVFVGRLEWLTAAFIGVALLVFAVGTIKAKNPRSKQTFSIVAGSVAAFAIGGALLVVLGLSGCLAGTEAGLTWNWPF